MFERYAIYVTPQGEFAARGAAWLGWDVQAGCAVDHPQIEGLDVASLTQAPRKYGLHGTIKPPFFLADGMSVDALQQAVAAVAADLPPLHLDGLEVRALAGFVALTPVGDQTALARMAALVVTQLDEFRAPPCAQELARRRKLPLSAAQEQHLEKWGYPYVMDQFRFHITLTGKVTDAARLRAPVAAHFDPVLPRPFDVTSLTLVGQDSAGMFHEIHRYPLSGGN